MPQDLIFKPVTELAPLLKAKKVSPVELVRVCLDRISATNSAVNAFLTVTAERAMEEAKVAEREIARGRYRGPLHGIPYAPKDICATKGIRTTNGSRVTANWAPDFESTVTARLARAGAILTGKLNLLEFAMGSGQKGLQGPARNPWDLEYSPSGSSSGSGAALAASMVPLTIGTDSGGSIRGPAKSCGVVGLKPTFGRVSRYGVTTLSWTLDHVGPMARSVADVALMLQAIAGPDRNDRSASNKAAGDYSRGLRAGLKGIRIGVAEEYFFDKVQPAVAAALRSALTVWKDLGAELVHLRVQHARMASAASAIILGAEAAAFHQDRLKRQGGEFDVLVRERLEASSFYSAIDYIKAQRVRTVLIEEMQRVFGLCDILMLPAGNVAPKLADEIVETDLPRNPPAPPRPDVLNLANMTGMPSLVLPCGFTSTAPVLPIGIQLCGRHFDESLLFRVGHAYQMATDWHRRVAPLAA